MNDINRFETTNEYWECNCALHYIHKTNFDLSSDEQVCAVCGFTSEDGADARVKEIEKPCP